MASIAINIDENSIPREHKASSMIDSQLHECLRQDSIEAFKSLVQTHFAEELVTPCGNTLLHVAVSYGSDKIIAYLAEEFPSLITTQNSQEDTILHLAAREGKDRDIIKSLVESNPCLMRKTNTKGNTPLHDAVIKGKSPVHAAIEQRNRGILDKIKEARPELLRLTEKELGNSLHYASSIGFLEGVQFLLQNFHDGAYERDSEGNYPIHIACKNDSVDVVKEYLDIFPYPKEFLNKKGQNILHVAAENGKDNVISYILKQDPKLVKPLVNEMDDDGNTPLHLAAGHFRPMASFLLVRHNHVARFIVNNRNWTPYDLAEQQSKRAEEEFLKANEMIAKEREQIDSKNSTPALENQEKAADSKKQNTKKASLKRVQTG
ncbi:hypothetical protein OIU76_015963 [Salix suchowensis]|nr:hypothetical protein OIU76_015963 [Salix suchowensis]